VGGGGGFNDCSKTAVDGDMEENLNATPYDGEKNLVRKKK